MAPANFKTYESQSRLLAAVIASAPELRLNFKEIAKYYGESTAQGIEFQFRSIKKDAKTLQAVAEAGGDTATALSKPGGGGGSGGVSNPSTPRKRKAASAATPGGSTSKRAKKTPKVEVVADGGDDDDAAAGDAQTPSRRAAAAAAARMDQTPGAARQQPTPDGDAAHFSVEQDIVVFKQEDDPLLSQHSIGRFDAVDDGEC